MEEDRLYTTDEVADILGLRPWTMRDWCRDGKLPGIKVGGQWRVKESDLKTYLETRHG